MSDRFRTLFVALDQVGGHFVDGQWVTDLRAHFDQCVQPAQEAEQAAHQAARAEHAAEREAMLNSVTVGRADREQRRQGNEVTATGGGFVAHAATESQARARLLERWVGSNPAPMHVTVSFDTWKAGRGRTTRPRWTLTLIDSDSDEQVLTELVPEIGSGHRVPVEHVHTHLGNLSAGGWHLVHVSEDRGVSHGAFASEESYVVRQRYLLRHRG